MKLPLILSLFAFTALAADPASEAPKTPATAGVKNVAPCCRPALPVSKPPSNTSLFLLESKWTSDRKATVPLSTFRGRPQIVAMFFSHCEYACPILVNDLKKIEASLPEDARRGADFLLVSIDPKRDTPEVLAAFRARLGLPLANWSLLRGGEDDVRELAALLGVNYAPDERGQFAHSNVITLLNAEGEVAFQQPGLRADPTLLIAAIQKAVAAAKP